MSASAQKASSSMMTLRPAPVSPPFTSPLGKGLPQDQHVLLCPPGRLWGILQGTSAFNSSKCEVLLNSHRNPEASQTEAPGITRGFGFTGADYCLLSDHGCEYSCVNTDRSFACQCPEGHVLRSDGKTCASKSDHM